tara:strand:+ start:361 stop:852 length:492 start_codon:yes stop_codon:yes gene_type:complete
MRSDSINTNSSEYGEYRRKVVDLRGATYNVEANESGTIYTINKADGIDIVLPAAEAGLEYEFHIGTTCTGDALTITADSSSDTYQGLVQHHDKDSLGAVIAMNADIDTSAFDIPAAADYVLTLNAAADGWYLGGMLKFTCIDGAKWVIQGHLFGDGTATHIFS